MGENGDIGNAPWSLRLALFTKPRAHSDTSVFNSKCIPHSQSSPELTRKSSVGNATPIPTVHVEGSSTTNLNIEEEEAMTNDELPGAPKKERSKTMRPKSSNSEKALDFVKIKIAKSERSLSERMSPRNLRKNKRKSRTEEMVMKQFILAYN